ncbi:uncharacterized protein J8A68_005027 [[Candida] subhashii]|uniref:L-type lectin-like domain-containing protein n=1 Tax=[Candida] subhashii TaxID=561895 RepID=A0A8J5QG59_9ASCO|nr:uncharacterized protein J8A68_005027 [[Candida] subhashii]KAG7661449.1 hypothetical protein J8A68_005027 [[Candida] subhashii]
MSFVFRVKRSRPLQFLFALLTIGLIYVIYTSNFFDFSSSSTYSPEEINSLLQNKESHIVTVKKKELTNQRLSRPYLDDSHFHVKNWDLKGSTVVKNNEYIRLTSLQPHLASNMFSQKPIEAESFEMELTFHIENRKTSLIGDGMAVWFLDKPSDIGDVFGVQNGFKGLGIMLDTYKNGKRGSFPFVNLMLGDGKKQYNKGTDGYETRLAGCVAKNILNPPAGETKMRIVYIKNGYLSIDFNYFGRHEEWMNCVTLTDVKLPKVKYLGLSAETGQLYENVDILENRIFGLYKPNGDEYVESIEELTQLIHDQNEYDSEVSEAANAIKQEKQNHNRKLNKKLNSQKRKSLKRLKNAEKRIKERDRQYRLEKYGDPDATFVRRWFNRFIKTIKYTTYFTIFITLSWFAWIIIRIQKQKKKAKTIGLLD